MRTIAQIILYVNILNCDIDRRKRIQSLISNYKTSSEQGMHHNIQTSTKGIS